MELAKILNLQVLTIRGFRNDMRVKKGFEPRYILFADKKTYIELEEQDYYTYHDCSSSARHIEVIVNDQMWDNIYSNLGNYPESDMDL